MVEDENGAGGSMGRRLAEMQKAWEEYEGELRNPSPRDRVELRVLGARTRGEIAEARRAMRRWVEEHPEDALAFGRMGGGLRMREALLDREEERRRGWGPRERQREALVDQGKRAKTPEKISEARRAMKGWLEEHPRDAEEFGFAETMMEERELGIEAPRRVRAEGSGVGKTASPGGGEV